MNSQQHFTFFTDSKFGGASKLGSGEGKQVFRPEGGEVDRESWESKLAYLLATVGYAVGRGSVWRCQYQARKKRGGWDLVLFIVVALIVKRLGQSHDRCCGPCIAITCPINSCFYCTCPCVFACHSQVSFPCYLANLWQPFSVLYFQGYCSHKTQNTLTFFTES